MAKRPTLVKARVNYLRVSNEETQYPERSFDYQRQAIEDKLAHLVGLPASHEYKDIERGTKTDRYQYQRMLADARAGLFSDLCIYRIDRFGRAPEEVFSATSMLEGQGIKIWVADMPNMEIGTPTGNFQFGLQTLFAKLEVDTLGQRVRDTKRKLMLQGQWPNHPPDGYIACREEIAPRKYRCWIEKHPTQSLMVRDAYDLWLTGAYTLKELCEELNKRGHTRESGKPFVWTNSKTGVREYAGSHIQRVLSNPFHAGWVISEKHEVQRGQVRGSWDAIVTDDELDRSIAIMREHDQNKSRQKRHIYILRGLLWLDFEGHHYPLHGSTPTGRSRSYGYYETKARCGGKHRRVRAEEVEANVPDWLQHILVNQRKLPMVRRLYTQHIDELSKQSPRRHLQELEQRLTGLEAQEVDLGRLLLNDSISEQAYQKLRQEWSDKMAVARLEYNQLTREIKYYQDDLEVALKMFSKVCWIFDRIGPKQKMILIRILARKVVIDLEGKIIDWELNSPFEYLSQLANGTLVYDVDAPGPYAARRVEAPPAAEFARLAEFPQRNMLQALPNELLGDWPLAKTG